MPDRQQSSSVAAPSTIEYRECIVHHAMSSTLIDLSSGSAQTPRLAECRRKQAASSIQDLPRRFRNGRPISSASFGVEYQSVTAGESELNMKTGPSSGWTVRIQQCRFPKCSRFSRSACGGKGTRRERVSEWEGGREGGAGREEGGGRAGHQCVERLGDGRPPFGTGVVWQGGLGG